MSEFYAYMKIKRISDDVEREVFLERMLWLDSIYLEFFLEKKDK